MWDTDRFCWYRAGLYHRHPGNHVIAPVSVKQSWQIWVNRTYGVVMNSWYSHKKTNHDKAVCIFCYCDVTWASLRLKTNRQTDRFFSSLFRLTKRNNLHHWSLVRGIHRWWILLTKGQWCGKRFHVMTSSYYAHPTGHPGRWQYLPHRPSTQLLGHALHGVPSV